MILRRTLSPSQSGDVLVSLAAQPANRQIFGGASLKEPDGSSVSYFVVRPARALRNVVTSYSQTEAVTTENAGSYLNIRTLFIPADSARMIFCYHDNAIRFRDERTSTRACGNLIGPHNLRTACRADNIPSTIKTFNVRFKPGGFCKLFGISPMETGNACFSVEDVLGKEGRLVEDRLNNSSSLEDRINILDRFFIVKLNTRRIGVYSRSPERKTDKTDAALELIRKHNGRIKVSRIAEALNISMRTMEWQFSHHIGLSAKEYVRIIRVNDVLNDVLYRDPLSWAEVAASHGYHDQMHMIKEFKAATTLTPDSFMSLRGIAFFTNVGILNFIDPASKELPFIKHLIDASVKMEEAFKAFVNSQHRMSHV